MRTSRRMLRQVRRAAFVAFVFSGCINILMLATPLYILQVFETVVPLASVETLLVLTVMAVGAIAALALIELARDRIMLRAGLWLDHELGQHMLENGLKAGTAPAEMQADARALEQFRAFLTSPAITPLFDAPWVPLFLGILFLLHPMIGMVAAGAAGLLLLSTLINWWICRRLRHDIASAHERAGHWLMTVAGSGSLFGALGLGAGAADQWERVNRAQIAGSYSLGRRSGFVKVFARTVRIGSQIAVYGLGAYLVIDAQLTPGALVASAILLARALGPLEQMVSAIRAIAAGSTAYRRLRALPADVSVPVVQAGVNKPAGTLKLADATFTHASRRLPAVRGISFEIAPGQCLGIVGPNGAGKSTLAGLIAGSLRPTTGSVELDRIPVYKWQRGDGGWPPIGYMPDDPLLIEGTVHENIARFRDVSVNSVSAVATKAGVHDTLSALPNGYDTQVGPAGSHLAMRERRAVALARALHGVPGIVVLDEPELGLDGASLRALTRVLSSLKATGTSLVIATQDPRLLALTDQVALIANGQLQSFGPSSELGRRYAASRSAANESEAGKTDGKMTNEIAASTPASAGAVVPPSLPEPAGVH